MPQNTRTTQQQIDELRQEIQREKQRAQGLRANKPDAAARGHKHRHIGRIAGRVAYIGIAALLVGMLIAVYTAKARGQVPSFFGGYSLFQVESGSMEPTLNIGSVILSHRPADAALLRVNDIVTFRTSSGAIVTHRIIEVVAFGDGGTAYRTKGDNPVNSPDADLLTPDRVIGVFVGKIPFS